MTTSFYCCQSYSLIFNSFTSYIKSNIPIIRFLKCLFQAINPSHCSSKWTIWICCTTHNFYIPMRSFLEEKWIQRCHIICLLGIVKTISSLWPVFIRALINMKSLHNFLLLDPLLSIIS